MNAPTPTPRTDEPYEIPAPVIEAARIITFWAATNGLNDFAIGGICSRKHLSKLERELSEAQADRDQLRKVVDAYSECHILHEENCNENVRPSRPCDCATGKIQSAYNSLPHVVSRKETK